jgi:endonuclease/exonuclease/phosphatase family metal-dependent hydrolase
VLHKLVLPIIIGFLVLNASLTSTNLVEADEGPDAAASAITDYYAPDTPTYDEMVQIARSLDLPASLKSKLDMLLSTAFVSNEAYLSGPAPQLSRDEKLGAFLRVGTWNIEYGLRSDEIKLAAENPEEFKRQVKYKPNSKQYREALEQLEVLRTVDVLVLNEVDFGLKRTDYRNIARELAGAFKMNFCYGVEFIEVDPVNLGTEEFHDEHYEKRKIKLRELIGIDKQRYAGLHGTAILSRFPIKRATLIPLKYKPYDWYGSEKKSISLPEAARRELGRLAFLEGVAREIRYGGRCILMAELDVPQLDERTLTVVATHLENRCGPSDRRRQMREVLSLINNISGPLVLAGDLNTSGSNHRPTTASMEIVRRIGSKEFWAGQLMRVVTPFGLASSVLFESAKFAPSALDPTSKGLFFFAPNKESELFKELEGMRFADGYSFDFRGDATRTVNGTEGTLANSNQRSRKKGFISTYATKRTFWAVGKSKLDWVFVKAYARNPKGLNEPYKMAPHFARTLEQLNHSQGHRISDHNPVTVDLPVEEPRP